MADNPAWEICERVAEVQALLDDHIAGGKHSAADVVAKAQAVLSESDLLRAMFDVGYFPPNTPPPNGGTKKIKAVMKLQDLIRHRFDDHT
jgi:hypothetical protein